MSTAAVQSDPPKKPKPADPHAGPDTQSEDEEALFRPITRDMALRLMARLKPWANQYLLVCVCGLTAAMLDMIPPRLVGDAIDYLRGPAFDDHGDLSPVLRIAGLWAAAAATALAIQGFQIGVANRAGERVVAQLRQDMFDHIQRLSMSYFDRTHSGRILARAGSDVDGLRNILMWGLNTLLVNSATMLLAAIMILRTDWVLFLAVAWLAPVLSTLNWFYRRRVGAAWQKARMHFSLLSANQAENIVGTRVVAAFNRQERNLENYDRLQTTNTENNVAACRINGVYQPLLQWIRFTGQAVILLCGGWRAATGAMTPGAVVECLLYWELFMNPAINFGTFFNEMMMAMAGAERVFALLDRKPEVTDVPGAPDLPKLTGNVRFENVSFGYDPGRPVLHGIEFAAAANTTVALVGATGSGKSSIVSLLARFYLPQSGRILVDGFDTRLHTGDSLHRQMGMVLQSNYLFTGSVMDNLRYGRPEATDAEVIAAAQALGCHEVFERFAEGYKTLVGERGASLSLGQRQLVCFTRALVADPRILLLDEATSSVDSETEHRVQTALARLTADRTTFVVAHRLSTIVRADCILVLDHGRIVERGTHAELLAHDGKYAELYRRFAQGAEV